MQTAPLRRLGPSWRAVAVVGTVSCSDYLYVETKPHTEGDSACIDAPGSESVDRDDDCIRPAEVGSFSPQVEWQWTENPFLPGYDDIMSTPAIGNLNDDNGDGLIDENDIPDVVFTAFAGGAYTSAGAITAISGDGSGTLWSVAPGVYSSGGVALGDLDGDGVPEVCAAGTSYAVVCLDNAGNLKWQAGTELSYVGSPAIADIDGNGKAEVIFGRQVFNADGTARWTGAAGTGGSQMMSFAADMDSDSELEIVAGNTVYDTDGTILWQSSDPDGIPAVGDFDGDGDPEVVTVVGGYAYLTDNGVRTWAVPVPGGGGGPPTVADFDGDGQAEIGVAGAYYYSVIETDGSTRWSMPVQDYSSSVTGSSVFDFEGDGAAEVVYADEVTLWVYDGATGAVEMQMDGHASGTLYEYPLIADVDHDGSSEIVVASNNYAFSGWNGITVIGDASASWSASRAVWNQFAYSITNVNGDLSIPVTPAKNWLSWNNFRAGGTAEGPSSWMPNLEPGELQVCTDLCGAGFATVWAGAANTGLVDADNVLVEVLGKDGIILASDTIPTVAAGSAEYVGPFDIAEASWGTGPLTVRVDGANVVEECDESDQSAATEKWPCP